VAVEQHLFVEERGREEGEEKREKEGKNEAKEEGEEENDEDGFGREHRLTEEKRAEEEALREWEDTDETVVDFEEELEEPSELEEKFEYIYTREESSQEKGKEKSELPSAFDILLEGGLSADWEKPDKSLRATVHTGMSERQVTYNRAKAHALVKEARSMPPLETFFKLARGLHLSLNKNLQRSSKTSERSLGS